MTWKKTLFASGFPGLVCLFENPITPSLARHNHRIFVVAFSSFLVNGRSFSAFCSFVRQSYDAGTNTYHLLEIPIRFERIDIREDANTHKAISCKYLSSSIGTLLLKNDTRITFALDTSFPQHTSTSCH